MSVQPNAWAVSCIESLDLFIKARWPGPAKTVSRVYLVGGASAVLLGWRVATIDIDLKIVPETDEILRSLPKLKEQLHLNIELASPQDFIPEFQDCVSVVFLFERKGSCSSITTTFMPRLWPKLSAVTTMI